MRGRLRDVVDELLEAGSALDSSDVDALIERLVVYGELIQRYGRRVNLVGDLSDRFVAEQLIGGSLQLLRVARPGGRLVDVGSGAGLPGIPLALALSDLEVDLVEVRQKRAAFLRRALMLLGPAGASVERVRVVNRDVEQVIDDAEPYDWAVARAFKPPVEWLPIARRLVGGGGRIGLYTTRSLWSPVGELGPGYRLVATADDPSGEERIVVVLEVS